MSWRLYSSIAGLGLMAAALSGCSDTSAPVTIDYRQIGFCDTYTSAGGVRSAQPNEVFAVYRVDSIDNAKRNADFAFIPTRIYVDPSEWGAKATPWKSRPGDAQDLWYRRDRRRFVSNDTSFAQAMTIPALAPKMITHGARAKVEAYSVIEVPAAGGRPVEQTLFKLSYDPQEGDGDSIPADPPIILNNANAAQESWPHTVNCKELPLDKFAAS